MIDLDPTEPFVERRKDAVVPLLELLRNIQHSVDTLDKKFDEHVVTQRDELSQLVTSAFPDNDPDGHRRHHEAVIRAAENRAEFWQKMRIAVAQWAGLGLLALAATAIWHEFLSRIPK